MRSIFVVVVVTFLVLLGTPSAEAQLRSEMPAQAPVKVIETGSAFSMNRLFSPEVFQMRHSYSLGMSSFGGMNLSMGEYTNSMLWNFNSKLAARVDIAFAHTPFGTGNASQLFGGKDTYGKLYLRNAEVAYRPTERTTLHLSVRQSPYGRYMNPYGYYGRGYGRGYYGDPFGHYGPYGGPAGYMGEFSWY